MFKKMCNLLSIVLVLSVADLANAGQAEWEAAIGGANPLHWYKFDETGTDCIDSGSGGLNGTYDGVMMGEDGLFGTGTAVGFERTGANRANFANATNLPGPWTVEYIVMTTKPPAANDSQALHDGDATSIRLAGWTALGEAGFTLYGVADYRFTPEPGFTLNDLVIQQNEWVHLTWRNNGAGTQFFLNGKLVGTSSDSVDLPRLRIGGRGAGPADHLMGVLDEAVVFDRALSNGEIVAHSDASTLLDPTVLGAGSPDPADSAIIPTTWYSFGWSAGATATSHDVYFSDNYTDVNDGTGDAFRGSFATPGFIAGFFGFPYPDGLVPGTTYYWRVDEIAPEGTHRGPIWSFLVPSRTAYAPSPADGARFVTLGATLGWTSGLDAKLHVVYFGDNFDDVSNAVGGTAQSPRTFNPGPLEKDKVYYWRVDELDPPNTRVGQVWSFRTLPDIPISDPTLVGWWKLNEGQGTLAVDWSGQNNHGSFSGAPEWVIGQDGGALKLDGNSWVECGTPNVLQIGQGITIACWINPTALGGERSFAALGGSYSFKASGGHLRFTTPGILDHDADNALLRTGTWQHVAVTFQPDQTVAFYINGFEAQRMVGSAANAGTGSFRIGSNQWNESFAGMIDDVRVYNKILTAAEITQAMRGDPLVAWDAGPANGSTPDIAGALPLNWQPGDKASSHDVYFGTDMNAVIDADASDTTGVYRGSQSNTSYTPPEGVEWGGGPYYWRVDERNTDGTVSTGNVWTFTVADHILVEDFESYNDIESGQPGSNLIYETWADGYGISTNGSTMGYAVPFEPTMETGTVHGGRQSAPMAYDNSTTASSEVTRTFTAQDWTANGVQTLSLWFYGDTANTAGQLYVKINGVKANYTGDAGDLSQARWHEFTIDLGSVGTNLQNVTSISVGVDGFGATGTLLLDDIRLYRPAGGGQ